MLQHKTTCPLSQQRSAFWQFYRLTDSWHPWIFVEVKQHCLSKQRLIKTAWHFGCQLSEFTQKCVNTAHSKLRSPQKAQNSAAQPFWFKTPSPAHWTMAINSLNNPSLGRTVAARFSACTGVNDRRARSAVSLFAAGTVQE